MPVRQHSCQADVCGLTASQASWEPFDQPALQLFCGPLAPVQGPASWSKGQPGHVSGVAIHQGSCSGMCSCPHARRRPSLPHLLLCCRAQAVGALVQASVATTPSGMSRGFGVVEFVTARDALNALGQLSNSMFMGRALVLRPEHPQHDPARSQVGAAAFCLVLAQPHCARRWRLLGLWMLARASPAQCHFPICTGVTAPTSLALAVQF